MKLETDIQQQIDKTKIEIYSKNDRNREHNKNHV